MPEEGDFESEIYLYENATTGDLITTVYATDLDRDSKSYLLKLDGLNLFNFVPGPYNEIQYYINYRNYPDLQRYFAVDGTSGELTVYLYASELDRDNGEPEHLIRIDFEDNYNGNGGSLK